MLPPTSEAKHEHLLSGSLQTAVNYILQTGLTCLKQETDAANDVSFSK